jgi:hypothetical protein
MIHDVIQQWACCPGRLSPLLSRHSKITISKRCADTIDILKYQNLSNDVTGGLLYALQLESRLQQVHLTAEWTSEMLNTALAIPTIQLGLEVDWCQKGSRFDASAETTTAIKILELTFWSCELNEFLPAGLSLAKIKLAHCNVLSSPGSGQPRGRQLELVYCTHEDVALSNRAFCF